MEIIFKAEVLAVDWNSMSMERRKQIQNKIKTVMILLRINMKELFTGDVHQSF